MSGLATNFWQLFAARLGVGVGEAGGVAPAYSLISDYFPPGQRARAIGIYSFGIPIGSATGIVFGGVIASLVDWRYAFFIVGLAGLVLATSLQAGLIGRAATADGLLLGCVMLALDALHCHQLADLADRAASSVTAHRVAQSGPLVLISHQDPIQAARLALTGRPLTQLHRGKPLHAEVIELRVGASERWIECGSWAPDQAPVPLPPTLPAPHTEHP